MAVVAAFPARATAAKVILKDDRVLVGKMAMTASMGETPAARAEGSPTIVFVDDDLRRTFVSRWQVKEFQPAAVGEVLEKFTIRQRTQSAGPAVRAVGPTRAVEPFDEWGRRTLKMNTAKGEIDVIQGVTEITPVWTKVQGINYVWEMRIATSSIPSDVLRKILHRQIRPGNVEDRKRVASLYLQSERYEDAYRELETILTEADQNDEVKKALGPLIEKIRQLSARRLLGELDARRDAGQDQFVLDKLKNFPTDAASGETLQAVREKLRDYEARGQARLEILKQIDALVAKIDDLALRKRIEPIRGEIAAELSFSTLGRMAAFREMSSDPAMKPADKLALAISGWLLGNKAATTQLSQALSLIRVRSLVRKYLSAAERLAREKLLEEFQSEEAGSPATVARLLAAMKPPVETAVESAEATRPLELEVPGVGSEQPPVRYLVQLPPEYDPYRRYPAIVTLHAAGMAPEQEIDWWAGPVRQGGWRAGHATRYGYIVIAPEWAAEHQKQYGFSAREHGAVLDSLRDACRRFAIDTDRVFLHGYSMGGDAAWDIGLAHPDLWAGVIPVCAKVDRYGTVIWKNAALVPFYFVSGDMDPGTTLHNSRDWDRYLRHVPAYNTTVVEFEGRGHEPFSDEILRLFDWMGRYRRNFFPEEFTARSMRPWDNFFWWVELGDLPARAMVDPSNWPPPRGTQPVETTASHTKTNGIRVTSGAGKVIVWLTAEMLDLSRKVNVTLNGRSLNTTNPAVGPDLGTLLEDARARGDRQHPFWAKVETAAGRTSPRAAGTSK